METLIITALGSDQTLLLTQLCAFSAKYNGSIEYSNMATFGNESVVTLLLSGPWNTIAKLEAALPTLKKTLGPSILYKRLLIEKKPDALLPYSVDVIALNQPGLLQEISDFFIEQEILIQSLQTQLETLKLSDAQLFFLNMKILVPGDMSISELREQFMLLCDDFNLDGVIEPEKFRV